MSVIRLSAVCLGSFLSIATILANPTPGDDNQVPVAAAAGGKPPGGAIHRGSGGVGFGAPHREDQLDALRLILEPAADDWKRISPKLDNLLTAKAKMATGAGMNWTRSHNAKPLYKPSAAQPGTAPGKAMQDVRDVVADVDASNETIAEKMAAVRAARKKARADYEAAEEELIATVTPRQHAILMTLGVVE